MKKILDEMIEGPFPPRSALELLSGPNRMNPEEGLWIVTTAMSTLSGMFLGFFHGLGKKADLGNLGEYILLSGPIVTTLIGALTGKEMTNPKRRIFRAQELGKTKMALFGASLGLFTNTISYGLGYWIGYNSRY